MHFSDMLASSVHDIKNSLGLVANQLEALLDDPATQVADRRQATLLQLEVQRANRNLVQLLALYKLDKRQLEAAVVEHNVEEFFDEIRAEHGARIEALGNRLETRCDPFLSGYFDDCLVSSVLGSTIGNAERYTRDLIELSADEEDGYLVLRVEDNGHGYPASLLGDGGGADAGGTLRAGHTQLGLYFAQEVAALHRNGDRCGFVRLKNGHRLSGGCFELWLP
jgi:signal transduction histidine kinase